MLADVVRDEVEENLLLHAVRLPSLEADKIIERYRHLVKLTDPEIVSYPDQALLRSSRHLIRHAADGRTHSRIVTNNDRLGASAGVIHLPRRWGVK